MTANVGPVQRRSGDLSWINSRRLFVIYLPRGYPRSPSSLVAKLGRPRSSRSSVHTTDVGWKRHKRSNEKPSLRSSSAFGLWTLADGHHDVNIGCALPHHEGATAVRVSGYSLQLRRVGNDHHSVRSGLHPLVVTGRDVGVRVGVAASHITDQHVRDADFVGFEGLFV